MDKNLYNVSRETFNEWFKNLVANHIECIFENVDFGDLSNYFIYDVGKIFLRINEFLNDIHFNKKSKWKCNIVRNDDIVYNVVIWNGYIKIIDFDLVLDEWVIFVNEKNGINPNETIILCDLE